MAMKWYVVHTYSGHENKAKLSLQDRVRQHNLQPKFGDVLIPTDTVVELVKLWAEPEWAERAARHISIAS